MNIGKTIRNKRMSKGLKQIYVAEKANINNNKLSRIELGYEEPNVIELAKIAEALGEDSNFFIAKLLDSKIKEV